MRSVHMVFVVILMFAAAAPGDANPDGYPARQEIVPDFGALIPVDPRAADQPAAEVALQRVTTGVPWARGLTMIDGDLIALSRGRHRGEGGPGQDLDDSAGTVWKIDVSVSEPVVPGRLAGDAVRRNAAAWIKPTTPPFFPYDRMGAPKDDILMTRPYCALTYDATSQNLFVCAYSGAELASGFRKHATDAVYRYDLRNQSWHIVEQHDHTGVPRDQLKAVIGNNYYPHHDPATNHPPHGWLNGPNGCIVVGDFLYVPAKDNHLVVQYDLRAIRDNPDAPPPPSRPVMGAQVMLSHPGGQKLIDVLGPSGVESDGNYLYVAYRTSSVVIRVRLAENGDVIHPDNGPAAAELIAAFEPFDRQTRRSGNLYDIALSAQGELFVSMGTEGRVWRFRPDPAKPFYGNDQTDRPTSTPPFLDLSKLVGKKTGCNNIYASPDGWLYVSTRNNDTGEGNVHGTIYRARFR